jgi:hypothetical protein
MLSNSRSFCKWIGATETVSPGFIQESRHGHLVQHIALESVLLPTNTDQDVLCVYDDSDVSGFVVLAALVITMMVKVPLDFLLAVVIMVLMADSHKHLVQSPSIELRASGACPGNKYPMF